MAQACLLNKQTSVQRQEGKSTAQQLDVSREGQGQALEVKADPRGHESKCSNGTT